MLNLIALLTFAATGLAGLACLAFRAGGRPPLRELLPGEALHSGVSSPGEGEGWKKRWERLALQAGVEWGWRLYLAVAGLGLAVGVAVTLAGLPLLGLLLLPAALFGPWLYLQRSRDRRAALFASQLPAALFLAASVLRSGGTLLQAVEAIAAEMPEPLGGEFRRVLAKLRLQVPAHQALAETQARVSLREFAAVVVAARLGAEVGGDLAHLFDEIGRAVVESQNAHQALRALTTEGRLSADLIAALPLGVMALLHLLSPEYFALYLERWSGRILLGLCLGTIWVGWRMVRRMVEIRIE